MKKYNFDNFKHSKHDPKVTRNVTSFLRGSKFLYFFMAWNAFGFAVYHYFKSKNDDWENMTSTQKYLSLTSFPEKEMRHIKVERMKIVEDRNKSVEEIIYGEDKPE